MTTVLILLIVAAALAIWQLVLFGGFLAMIASGKYNKVTVGVWPGIIAVILVIIAVLL